MKSRLNGMRSLAIFFSVEVWVGVQSCGYQFQKQLNYSPNLTGIFLVSKIRMMYVKHTGA